MLILMDIDATMIKTQGAGLKAMVQAGREVVGEGFSAEGVDFAGRLDPLIIADMLRGAGADPTPAIMGQVRARYAEALARHLTPGAGTILPGVAALLADLSRRSLAGELALGVLTGNFEETGCLKLRACGIDPDQFQVRVWGDDSPHDPPARDHLPPVGFRRYESRFGRTIDPGQVTIVGDTPHDIACARAHGCRSLGVATGQFTTRALADSGADRAVETLADTHDIASWLMRDR
jgi:phosphoglycolate phosphatase